MTAATEKLFLNTNTTVTCPKCKHEFSLEQGFAKKALEHLADASSGAIEDLQESVRVDALKRAERESAEQTRLAQAEPVSYTHLDVYKRQRLHTCLS